MADSRVSWFFSRLRGSYWFVPSTITLAAIALAVGLIHVDERLSPLPAGLGWIYTGGAEGARSLMSAVAGSIVTVVSVTFSVTVVALTVSSQHFGPRVLNSFMRDTAAQVVLGVFIATFAYCVVVLRTVRGVTEGITAFVPHLAVTAGVGLTLLSVAMLIFYVHHVSASLQVTQIVRGVAKDFESAIAKLYPQRIGQSEADVDAPRRPEHAAVAVSPASGYVQRVDPDRLLKWATDRNAVVWIAVRPGDFAGEGEPLAYAANVTDTDGLVDAFSLGNDRTADQDAGFAVQQLVEVALHALSPGINEPFTAITCIDWLGQGLGALAARSQPPSCRVDRDGQVRVVATAPAFQDLLDAAFTPLRGPSAPLVLVAEHLLRTLGRVGRSCTSQGQREAVVRQLAAVHRSALEKSRETMDRERLDTAYSEAMHTMHEPGSVFPRA